MSQPELRGICPIVDTPFTPSGDVDYAGLESLAETLVDDGCHALALFGFASEFYKLTEAEREQMTEVVVDVCDEGDVPSVVSVTAQATDVAVQEAKQIEEKGADTMMLLPPYIRDPPTDAIAEHIERVARSVSIPVMVQYAPGSTGVTLSPEFLADLYDEVANVDYFKVECDPPGKFIDSLHDLTNGGANVLVGRAGYEMIEGYDRGAVGVMPASAMYDIYLQIHEDYHAGNRAAAVDLHSDLVAVLNQLTKVGIQWDKRILAERGLIQSDHCRAPENSFDDTYDALFEEYYEKYVLPNIDVEASTTTLD